MKFKKVLGLVLAVAMVFCLSVGAFAKEYQPSYEQNQSTSDAVSVKVTVEGLTVPYTEKTVALPAKTGDTQKVLDAMLAVNADSTDNITFYASGTTPVAADTTYFTSVNGDTGSGAGYSGWVFRINGGFPMESAGLGASIATATITDGDVISFYIDDPSSADASAKFTRINESDLAYANGVVSAKVTSSYQYFDASWNWEITRFANMSGATVNVYDSTGALKGTGTTNSIGKVSISTGALAQGTYTVKVVGDKTTAKINNTTATVAFTVQ